MKKISNEIKRMSQGCLLGNEEIYYWSHCGPVVDFLLSRHPYILLISLEIFFIYFYHKKPEVKTVEELFDQLQPFYFLNYTFVLHSRCPTFTFSQIVINFF